MQQFIPPVHNPIFVTCDNLHDIVAEAVYALDDGELSTNRLCNLFGSYHNTLIKKLEEAARQGGH